MEKKKLYQDLSECVKENDNTNLTTGMFYSNYPFQLIDSGRVFG